MNIPATLDELIDSYTDIVKYTNLYFNIIENNLSISLDIWAKMGAVKMQNENFKAPLLLIELCLFNHMKYVKSSLHTSLSQYNLNCILMLKLLGVDISLEYFDEKLAYQCVLVQPKGTLYSYFINAVQELEINRSLHINNERKLEDPIDDNIDRFKNHPSINRIYQNGFTSNSFHFRKIVIDDVYEVLKSLNPSKAFQNVNIPPSSKR